jgi:hypothetical protein
MTRIALLEQLREETRTAVKDLLFPVKPPKEGPVAPSPRVPAVHLMRLPDSTSAESKAPYVLHQLITGKDMQRDGDDPESVAVVRSICVVYAEQEEDGALNLLNLMERLRIHLLKKVVIGKRFMLDLTEGLETLVYPEDTAPFFRGEMISVWKGGTIEREVSQKWRE